MAHELNEAEDLKLWPPAIEKLFIDIMVEEQAKGNMKTGVFKKRTWTKIRNELDVRANRCFVMQQLRQNLIGSEQNTRPCIRIYEILEWAGILRQTRLLPVMKFGRMYLWLVFYLYNCISSLFLVFAIYYGTCVSHIYVACW